MWRLEGNSQELISSSFRYVGSRDETHVIRFGRGGRAPLPAKASC